MRNGTLWKRGCPPGASTLFSCRDTLRYAIGPHRELLARRQQEWPELAVDPDAFAQFLETRDAADPTHAADLYLASACVSVDPAALTAFDRRYLADVERISAASILPPTSSTRFARRYGSTSLRASGRALPRTSGRGSLASWLRVAALRIASNLRRAAGTRYRLEERGSEPAALPTDPELALIRRRYAAPFERALAGSFASLDERDRNLLRLHLLDGLGIHELAPLFRVHRATAARWLQAARAHLKERVLDRLRTELRVNERELQSLVRVVESHLEISLRTFFRSGPTAANGP